MDSVVGATALSWLYGNKNENLKYSPVINCQRNELKYRIEIMQHLARFDMDEKFINESFLFIEDLQSFHQVESVGLVDFNQLNKEIDNHDLCNKIHYIVDHHVDNELYGDTLKEKDIRLVGSATTLVT
jgi:inorganic pyrophosphatase/exopolyphosphatase